MCNLKWRQRVPQMEYSPFDSTINKLAAIHGIADVNSFLKPSSTHINNPYLLWNANVGTDRIVQAVQENQKIVIVSDVDTDGVSATAIVYNYLKKHQANVSFIHAQRKDGHGLHTVIDKVPEDTDVLIVLDSSSNNWKECRELKSKGIDIIIIDHHQIETPNYYSVLINPQQEACQYPNKEISGAALAWQICRMLDDKMNRNFADELIDLAAIGLIADTMCMRTMENRAIVNLGLEMINNLGLKTIIRSQELAYKKLGTIDIGYKVVSLLNAAARMNKLELSLELLTTNDEERASEITKQIKKLNTERKSVQSEYIEHIVKKIDPSQKIIIYFDHNKEISKSFAGLIAGQIANTYMRPCLIMSPDESQGKTYAGSYRSFGDFDLKAFFESIPLVESTGGHAGAGGINVKNENLDQFVKMVEKRSKYLDFEDVIEYDLEFDADEINEQLIYEINEFYRISGRNFPIGKFLVKNIFVIDTKVKGKGEDTVEVVSENLSLMKFKTTRDFADKFPIFSVVDVVGTLGINEWFNFKEKKVIKTNQMILDDFRIR